jgi:hypothetical protein
MPFREDGPVEVEAGIAAAWLGLCRLRRPITKAFLSPARYFFPAT